MYPNQQHVPSSGHCKSLALCNNSNERWFAAGATHLLKPNQGADVSLTIMLICAVLASLGVGVLLAYGLCFAMFEVFRVHSQRVAGKAATPVAVSAQAAKS